MTTENDILSNYLQSLYGIEPLSVKEEHGKASHEHHRIVFIFTHFGANLPS